MDKFALLVRMNPQDWPEWERKIGPGQESKAWFITGRRKPEEIHAGLPVVVLGTNRMGVLATGETVSAAEFRADPDWTEATDPSEQAWLREPRNRVCILGYRRHVLSPLFHKAQELITEVRLVDQKLHAEPGASPDAAKAPRR